jgi:hypothetical protein
MYAFAIDWDGTCVESAWPDMGRWNPGAVEGLHALAELGTVIIHTLRIAPVLVAPHGSKYITWDDEGPAREIRAIRKKLDRAGLEHVEIWTRPYKPPALVYVDDRGFKFEGDWGAVVDYVEALVAMEPPQVAVKGSA